MILHSLLVLAGLASRPGPGRVGPLIRLAPMVKSIVMHLEYRNLSNLRLLGMVGGGRSRGVLSVPTVRNSL